MRTKHLPWEKRESRDSLKALNEDSLRDDIIIPLFKARGKDLAKSKAAILEWIDYQAVKVHGPVEPEHKCDVLLVKHEAGSTSFKGIQAKTLDITGATDVQKIRTDAEIALGCPYKGSDGGTHCLDLYYWITSGDLKPNGRRAACTYLDSPASRTFGRVILWDCLKLIDEIQLWKPDLLPPLELLTLKEKISNCKSSVFSSWYAYQAFRWYLRHKRSHLPEARKHLEEAKDWLLRDPRAALYFKRTLARFYQMWIDLVDSAPELLADGKFDPASDVENEQVRQVLQSKYPGTMYWLLGDVSFMLEQLNLLADQYANAPAGLSTLQICQLLLRATYPPELDSIAERLDTRVIEELANEDGKSIDQHCSLCTGAAISCLSLAYSEDKDKRRLINRAFRWVTGKDVKNAKYAYHPDLYVDAKIEEHALHYSASVLEGVLAFEYPNCQQLNQVLRVFFSHSGNEPENLEASWMKYRNINRFEVYTYILPAILRYLLAGLPLEAAEMKFLGNILQNMVRQLCIEAEETSVPPWRPYAGRENLGSLCLSFLLTPEDVPDPGKINEIIRNIVQGFHRGFHLIGQIEAGRSKPVRLWDSNVDRTTVFIDAYLLYWETLLEIESRGNDVEKIRKLLPEPI